MYPFRVYSFPYYSHSSWIIEVCLSALEWSNLIFNNSLNPQTGLGFIGLAQELWSKPIMN